MINRYQTNLSISSSNPGYPGYKISKRHLLINLPRRRRKQISSYRRKISNFKEEYKKNLLEEFNKQSYNAKSHTVIYWVKWYFLLFFCKRFKSYGTATATCVKLNNGYHSNKMLINRTGTMSNPNCFVTLFGSTIFKITRNANEKINQDQRDSPSQRRNFAHIICISFFSFLLTRDKTV